MKRMKQWITGLLLTAMLCALLPCAPAAADSRTAYWHEKSAAANHPDCMAALSDATPVSQLSVPGTHDSMAYTGTVLLKDISLTQSMNLAQQLQSGIRYLDIRIDYETTFFSIYHGPIYLRATFDNVLNTLSRFLREHPGEFILMRLKQENDKATSGQMADLFTERYYSQPQYSGLFYDGGSQNPTVGELRGKILILRDGLPLPCGINYRAVDRQDYYRLSSPRDLYNKWERVKAQLESADSGNSNTVYMNHLSGSNGALPFFVASGKVSPCTNAMQLSTGVLFRDDAGRYPDFPRKRLPFGLREIDYLGTNQLTADYISENRLSMVGIIPADFPGAALIESVIACNFR